jgi:hypothetical protein
MGILLVIRIYNFFLKFDRVKDMNFKDDMIREYGKPDKKGEKGKEGKKGEKGAEDKEGRLGSSLLQVLHHEVVNVRVQEQHLRDGDQHLRMGRALMGRVKKKQKEQERCKRRAN